MNKEINNKIEILEERSSNEFFNYWSCKIIVDDNEIFNGSIDEEDVLEFPEKMTIKNKLSFVHELKDLLFLMYEAGKKNIQIEYILKEEK